MGIPEEKFGDLMKRQNMMMESKNGKEKY